VVGGVVKPGMIARTAQRNVHASPATLAWQRRIAEDGAYGIHRLQAAAYGRRGSMPRPPRALRHGVNASPDSPATECLHEKSGSVSVWWQGGENVVVRWVAGADVAR